MTPEPTTRYARSGDIHIAYHLTGEGALDLLLVPDGVIPIEAIPEEPSFDRFIRRLGTFSRVVRFDRRGMGLSDPVTPAHPPTLELWMEDAETVLDAIGSERAALLGMAEGAFVVSLLAATRPQRVTALALVNATPGFTAEPFRGWGFAAEAIETLGGKIETDWGETAWAIPMFAPSAVNDRRYLEWLTRAIRRSLSPAMAQAVFDVMFRSDIRDVLPTIRVPTLIVHRRGNRYLTPEHGRYLAEHIHGARYVEVEGDDHVPYLGDQGAILDEIETFLTGTRRRMDVDRVLSTVVFTDVVGSTEKAVHIGDRRWRELLLAYHELSRQEVEGVGGRVVDTAGDGVFAAFDGPARAVQYASAMVGTVRRLGIEIRAGIHTGECELLEAKLGGIAVHIGARIASMAAPSEVLVSSTVKDLVAGSGIRFEDRGMYQLKGVSDEWRVYAVDLRSTAG